MSYNFARTTHYRKLDHDSMVIVLNIDPTVTYPEGCPCYFDKTNGVALPITETADNAKIEAYCGLAQASNPVAHHPKPIKKMSFYIGDVIAKMFFTAEEAVSYMTPVFPAVEIGAVSITPAAEVTSALGHVIIDAEEFKTPRNTAIGEEVSVLMRPSIFKTRTF